MPHLAWYHRGEGRIVEYGSSFPAMRAVGARQALRDAVFDDEPRAREPRRDDRLRGGRGRRARPGRDQLHLLPRPDAPPDPAARGSRPATAGTRRSTGRSGSSSSTSSSRTTTGRRARRALAASRARSTPTPASIGRWLVTRDGFDFLVFYLPDFDYASHLVGPTSPVDALARRRRRASASSMEAAGGPDELLDRYGVVLCSDHGQTHVEQVARLQEPFADLALLAARRGDPSRAEAVVTGVEPLRDGLPAARLPARRARARRAAGRVGAARTSCSSARATRRSRGARARSFASGRPGDGWETNGDPDVLDEERYPNGLERAWHALACPNAGEVLVSGARGLRARRPRRPRVTPAAAATARSSPATRACRS